MDSWGALEVTSSGLFFGCTCLTSVPNGLAVSTLNNFFRDCSVFNSDISLFDLTGLALQGGAVATFYRAIEFNQDISEWDFSKTSPFNGFMTDKSSENYHYHITTTYLIKWDSDPSVGGLDFGKLTNFTTDFGTIQYSSAGAAAHASLVAKGLIINDGGQNAF